MRLVAQCILFAAAALLTVASFGCARPGKEEGGPPEKASAKVAAVHATDSQAPKGTAEEQESVSRDGQEGGAERNEGHERLEAGQDSAAGANGSANGNEGPQMPKNPFPRRVLAPPLTGGKEWLNTAGPLDLRDLRGKIVLLDFWTYCCINCMHILPELKRLERKYAEELVVIGVHSAKFDTERDSQNIREAIIRYEIEHPVVNDAEMRIWRRYGARAWPTLVLIDPEGYAVLMVSGEGWFDVIEEAIEKLIEYHSAKGTLKRGRMHFALEREKLPPTPLRFPGKVWADEASGRLFISDSNHNRIVIATLEGELLDIIGSGRPGWKDGKFEEAEFLRPQGIVLVGSTLYVADTENHLIRACDLEKRTVRTVAGTGKQGWVRPFDPRPALQTPISSPWDVCWIAGKLYIAMAGLHQIWVYDPEHKAVQVYAGSGREGIVDGPPASAEFAQPSGLSTDGRRLFVADSESSGVRIVYTDRQGVTETVVGLGLFDFGDRDGVGDEVRLQHPLHVAYWRDDLLFVADTYNNKIKLLNVATRKCESWLGGPPGRTDDPPRFDEPGGLAIANGKLYVADTNNHLIRVVDLETKKVSTLHIEGLEPPSWQEPEPNWYEGAERIRIAEQRWPAQATVKLQINLELPPEFKLNPLAPMQYEFHSAELPGIIAPKGPQPIKPPVTEITIEIATAETGKGILELGVTYFPCRRDATGACFVRSVVWEIPYQVVPAKQDAQPVTLRDRFEEP